MYIDRRYKASDFLTVAQVPRSGIFSILLTLGADDHLDGGGSDEDTSTKIVIPFH